MSKKVSLVVCNLAHELRWGGARPFILAQALQKIPYPVEIIGLTFEPFTPPPDLDISIQVFPGKNYPSVLKSFYQLSQKIDGDIIYAYKPKPSSFGISLIKKMFTGRPLILDIDDWEMSWYGGDEWQYKPGSLKQFARDILKPNGALRNPDYPLYLKAMEGLTSRADAITIHTGFIQQRFGGIYLPNGKDTTLFNPENYNSESVRSQYNLSDYRILMFPGAPRPYKGIEDVLMALDILNQPDLRLVIVGGSPYDDYDQKLREKWGQWLISIPPLPVTKMPEIVAAADIIVVPQRNHPSALAQFPLKLTDGMAMAKPVLSTNVGDIPDILGNTGYLVAPSSPEQIAEMIQHIFSDFDQAQEKGIAARKRCVEHYSIEAMANILASILSQY
ncbi:glycosyltransferase family 4 protein [Planktothrix paucivesiculata]|uniref:Glycosyl transferase, group 1 n=1 Tax=Planktothrix paucivesiculata PCC 9631 TaxID=671071 RepID=A0A7Z9DYD8_9CYAN|nr:glycosyltransferase family 4 protein [Planktothrix paucivesiculata]VXD17904.1 Glycosyl transferase, group 1 [Planktothrix paucivesiculata PCC 9631]